MDPSLLEIIEIADGEVVLQRADGEGDPLVVISFSEESRVYMPGSNLQIAQAMIQAGIEKAAELAGHSGEIIEVEEEFDEPKERVLH